MNMWEHGYKIGVQAAQKTHAEIVGKWFHTFDKDAGRVGWQGQILSIDSEFVVVQLYSWLTGCENGQKIVPKNKITEWKLYATSEEMKLEYDKRYAHEIKLTDAEIGRGDKENGLTSKILNAIQSGPKTTTEISNYLSRNVKSKKIQVAIVELIEKGEIKVTIETGAGRPTTKYKSIEEVIKCSD